MKESFLCFLTSNVTYYNLFKHLRFKIATFYNLNCKVYYFQVAEVYDLESLRMRFTSSRMRFSFLSENSKIFINFAKINFNCENENVD